MDFEAEFRKSVRRGSIFQPTGNTAGSQRNSIVQKRESCMSNAGEPSNTYEDPEFDIDGARISRRSSRMSTNMSLQDQFNLALKEKDLFSGCASQTETFGDEAESTSRRCSLSRAFSSRRNSTTSNGRRRSSKYNNIDFLLAKNEDTNNNIDNSKKKGKDKNASNIPPQYNYQEEETIMTDLTPDFIKLREKFRKRAKERAPRLEYIEGVISGMVKNGVAQVNVARSGSKSKNENNSTIDSKSNRTGGAKKKFGGSSSSSTSTVDTESNQSSNYVDSKLQFEEFFKEAISSTAKLASGEERKCPNCNKRLYKCDPTKVNTTTANTLLVGKERNNNSSNSSSSSGELMTTFKEFDVVKIDQSNSTTNIYKEEGPEVRRNTVTAALSSLQDDSTMNPFSTSTTKSEKTIITSKSEELNKINPFEPPSGNPFESGDLSSSSSNPFEASTTTDSSSTTNPFSTTTNGNTNNNKVFDEKSTTSQQGKRRTSEVVELNQNNTQQRPKSALTGQQKMLQRANSNNVEQQRERKRDRFKRGLSKLFGGGGSSSSTSFEEGTTLNQSTEQRENDNTSRLGTRNEQYESTNKAQNPEQNNTSHSSEQERQSKVTDMMSANEATSNPPIYETQQRKKNIMNIEVDDSYVSTKETDRQKLKQEKEDAKRKFLTEEREKLMSNYVICHCCMRFCCRKCCNAKRSLDNFVSMFFGSPDAVQLFLNDKNEEESDDHLRDGKNKSSTRDKVKKYLNLSRSGTSSTLETHNKQGSSHHNSSSPSRQNSYGIAEGGNLVNSFGGGGSITLSLHDFILTK